MKKSVQISGLPIINISEGNQVGKVKALVINPEKGSVDFLTIEHEDWQVSVKAIPFKKVIGIGEYAVTIESENAVIDLNEIPIANQLVNKKIKIIGTKVMTRKGELLGDVKEFFVDQDSGQILGMLLNVANKETFLSSEFVVTFGKDIIIVKEDASSNFLESAEALIGEDGISETEELSSLLNDIEPINMVEDQQDIVAEIEQADLQELKQKQIDLLFGKKLINNIMNKDGSILFDAGTILSVSDIELAQEAGIGVVVELSMNVEY